MKGIHRRLCAAVFIKILHSTRSKTDPKRYKEITIQDNINKRALAANLFIAHMNRKRHDNINFAFNRIENTASGELARIKAIHRLASLIKSRTKLAFSSIRNCLNIHGLERENAYQGLIILHSLINVNRVRIRSLFFQMAKSVFNQMSSVSPASRARMVKTNSLIIATSNNIFYGMQSVEKIIMRRVTDSFKIIRLFYRLEKSKSNSLIKIVEKKLESLFVKRKGAALLLIKKYATNQRRRRELVHDLVMRVHTLLNRKNEVYTVFYELKHQKNDRGKL